MINANHMKKTKQQTANHKNQIITKTDRQTHQAAITSKDKATNGANHIQREQQQNQTVTETRRQTQTVITSRDHTANDESRPTKTTAE